MTPSMHFQQFYQMRIIRITLLKLQALKLSELGWKYLRNYWGRLWQKCDKYIATLYVTEVIRLPRLPDTREEGRLKPRFWLPAARSPCHGPQLFLHQQPAHHEQAKPNRRCWKRRNSGSEWCGSFHRWLVANQFSINQLCRFNLESFRTDRFGRIDAFSPDWMQRCADARSKKG